MTNKQHLPIVTNYRLRRLFASIRRSLHGQLMTMVLSLFLAESIVFGSLLAMQNHWLSVIVFLACQLLLLTAFVFFVRRQMVQPILHLLDLARKIGRHEDRSIAELANRRDEIGSLGRILIASDQEVERQQQALRLLSSKMDEERRRDPLTGLYNRRHLYLEGPNQFAMAHRLAYAISVMMIDLDFFKKINDTYGHSAGDAVLVAVANTLKKHSRAYDLLIRFGGEEFTFVLLNCDQTHAVLIASRIREDIESLHVTHDGSAPIPVTCSIGACSGINMNIEQMIQLADESVYKAKDAGRNCVHHASYGIIKDTEQYAL